MATKVPTDKRTRIVDAAAKLIHEQGFHQTSLADISRESDVPLGNVSYYFKTKDSIGEAVIERLAGAYDMMRETWESTPDPKARLVAFVQMTVSNRESLARSGCPIGTLCAELPKEGSALADRAANLFGELLKWLEAQFRELGKGGESRDLAAHLLAAVQGASLLTLTFHDPRYVTRESTLLKEWIRSL
jgi:AcrR family transcriptional regulator